MDDKKKKKEFIKPTAEIVDFANDDIITFSNGGEFPEDWTGETWGA